VAEGNGRLPITYVNFHGKKFVDFSAVIDRLRVLTDGGTRYISLEKLIEWLEAAELPEPTSQ
jgi:hypothetical protein